MELISQSTEGKEIRVDHSNEMGSLAPTHNPLKNHHQIYTASHSHSHRYRNH